MSTPLWLQSLQEASFRKVEFHVDSIDVTSGHNVVVREYPFQDQPTVFRMGQSPDQIRISAYVIGDDYQARRAALRAALDAPGDGELVHPTAGTLRVFVADKYTIREAPSSEGGLARFDITFVAADARRYPQGVPAFERRAFVEAQQMGLALQEMVAREFSVVGKPGWVADQAVDRVRKSVEGVWGRIAAVSAQLGSYANTAIGNYQVLRDGLNDLVRTPAQLADHLATLFELPEELTNASARHLQAAFKPFINARERITSAGFEVAVMPAVGAGLVMFGTGSAAALQGESPHRAELKRLMAVSDRFFEAMSYGAFIKTLGASELQNYDEVMALRNLVHEQGLRLMLEASEAAPVVGLSSTHLHASIAAVHSAALADLQYRGRDLVRLDTYTPAAWTPVWVISYQLYGTPDYADEILAANPHIEHPLLVPPGRPLRVAKH